MKHIRVKVCGITSVADAALASKAGADAIGVIFHESSPRNVDIATAVAIKQSLPPFVDCIAVVRNADRERVSEIVTALEPDYVQFHGDESLPECERYGVPYIKAVPMGGGADVLAFAEEFSSAAALLLDSHGGGKGAGKGVVFDWNAVPEHCDVPLILAGGLAAENVTEAIRVTQPYAVDVASGVECKPGVKDKARIIDFFRGVNRA